MQDEKLEVEQGGTPVQPGTQGIEGQPDTGTENVEGEPEVTKVQPEGEPDAGEELSAEETPEQKFQRVEADYKELQGKFSKTTDESKSYKEAIERFKPYGGVEQVERWVQALANNESFAKWVQDEQSKQMVGGINLADADDETKRAIDVMQKVASQVVEQKVAQRVKPLEDKLADNNIASLMTKMDEDYPEWREVQDKMSEITPKWMEENPTLRDFKALWHMALEETGKFDDYAKSRYTKSLEEKKQKSTEKPQTTVAKGAKKKAQSIEESYEDATKELGARF